MMFRKSLFFVVLLVLISFSCEKALKWSRERTKGAPPHERYAHACGRIGNKMYTFFGRLHVTSWTDTVHVLNLDEMRWDKVSVETQRATEKVPSLYGHTATPIADQKFFIYGGRSDLFKPRDDMYEFDVASETLKLLAPTGTSPGGRYGHCAVEWNKKVLIFGGESNNKEYLKEVFTFDPAKNEWEMIPTSGDIPNPVQGHQCVLYGDTLFVFGGAQQTKPPRPSSDIYQLDTSKWEWRKIYADGKPRAFHTATLATQYIYLIGGQTTKGVLGDTHIFDPLAYTFVPEDVKKGDVLSERQSHCAVEYNGKVIVFGGIYSREIKYNDVFVLDTTPEATAAETSAVDLSTRISRAIVEINLLLQRVNDTDAEGEKPTIIAETKKMVEADTDDSLTAGLPERLKLWGQVEGYYRSLIHAKEDMKNVTSTITLHLDDVAKVQGDVGNKKITLKALMEELQGKLDSLRDLEYNLKDEMKKKQLADEASEQEDAKSKKLELEVSACEREKRDKEQHITNLQRQINYLNDRVSTLTKHIENAHEITVQLQAKEKLVMEDLSRVRGDLAKAQEDADIAQKRLQLLNLQLAEINRNITQLDGISARAELAKKLLDGALKSLQNYTEVATEIIDKLKEPILEIDVPAVKGLSLEKIDQAISQRRSALNELKLNSLQETKNLQQEIQKINSRIKGFEIEESTLKKRLDGIQKRLSSKGNEKKITEQRDELEAKLRDLNSELVKTKIALDELEKSCEQKKVDANESRKAAVEKARLAREQEEAVNRARADLEAVKRDLKLKFDSLMNSKADVEAVLRKLDNMRLGITVARREYEAQRTDVVAARQKLQEKLQEIAKFENERVIELEKELEEAKAKIAEQEATIEKLQRELDDCKKDCEQVKGSSEKPS